MLTAEDTVLTTQIDDSLCYVCTWLCAVLKPCVWPCDYSTCIWPYRVTACLECQVLGVGLYTLVLVNNTWFAVVSMV